MFHDKLIIRTPTFPFSDNLSEAFLKQILDNPKFAEAVYLASPVLFQDAIQWKDGKITDPKKLQKIPLSLGKYYTRMCSRCTPFGLFAGCGVVEWNEVTDIEVATQSGRNTRLDMHFAGALAQRLAEIPEIKFSLKYSQNSSIYQIGEEIRYVEYKYVNGRRTHQISAITWSEYIQLVLDLCKNGATIQEIIPHLLDDDVSEEDASVFIEQLIDDQLLVNELEPAITGEDFTKQIRKILAPQGQLAELLDKIDLLLTQIDSNDFNPISAYEEVIETLKIFGVPFEEGKLFQTDSVKLFTKFFLDEGYKNVFNEISEILSSVQEVYENQSVKNFKKLFSERYETKEVPLLFALDTETGIGYSDTGKSNNTPIAEGLILPEKQHSTTQISLNVCQQKLFNRRLEALQANEFQVALEDDFFKELSIPNAKLSPSASMMFRLTGDEKLPIFFEGKSGSSAINLLGRFAHADKDVLEIIQEIADVEQSKNPEVVFAEIVHLPENRIGNILLHPPFRKYEIPYLAKSSLANENQLPLDDLLVSVDLQLDRIVLRSKKLGKEVIPRLSNAHNFSQNSLPIYHFLSDLQTQGFQKTANIPWTSLIPNANFIPRLTYKNVILSLATWYLKKDDVKALLVGGIDTFEQNFKDFLTKWKLPKYFVLADFDNELLVNIENPLSVQIWLDAIKKREKIELKEFFYQNENSPVKNADGEGFTNQFIAAWINDDVVYERTTSKQCSENTIQRNFSLGSEWLYMKFYTGVKVADTILVQAIKPVLEKLFEEKIIDKWFFIRYADPEKHLRFRVHLPDLSGLGIVFQYIKEAVQPFENEGIIWKVQADTYQREIERYGANVIELSETLFCEDSNAILQMLDQTWGDEREPIRWQWTLKVIDVFLDDFGLSLAEKKNLLERMKTSFANEFGIDKSLKLQIDQRFRENRRTIERILDNSLNESHEYAPLFEAIYQKSQRTNDIIEQIKLQKTEMELLKYLSDNIHMTVNRAISDNQRVHELVMYDFLFRYYQAEIAKRKKA
ncbi:thiopeptide-type bacteriocin biosynthesis protein [Arcicella aurantiaca]|uniref:Thiopeptide-type bacteriocin biosynthesis protein n=1 Tax=Arcicella aurantiaca TaxID=591202 RepID=A0A316E6S2_9BACT|nr:lantibiotic dehydratase [Arcicella aurantiaca]PWK25242.1 thiopeptide-type bacteriocin biosynthesis protein [Arcicella aurantiaca]